MGGLERIADIEIAAAWLKAAQSAGFLLKMTPAEVLEYEGRADFSAIFHGKFITDAQLSADQLVHAAALALKDAANAALQAKLEEANKRAITPKEAEDILGVMVDHCGDCATCAGSVASRMCSGGYLDLQAKLKNIAGK